MAKETYFRRKSRLQFLSRSFSLPECYCRCLFEHQKLKQSREKFSFGKSHSKMGHPLVPFNPPFDNREISAQALMDLRGVTGSTLFTAPFFMPKHPLGPRRQIPTQSHKVMIGSSSSSSQAFRLPRPLDGTGRKSSSK
jgi:hypothetical protein